MNLFRDMKSRARRVVAASAAVALLFAPIAPSYAAIHAPITLNISQGRLISLPSPASSVFIADPAIADVQVPIPSRVFVFGKHAGHTTLFALDAGGRQILSVEIDVENDTVGPTRVIARNPGAGGIHVLGTDNGLALEGRAVNAEAASDASRGAVSSLNEKQQLDDHVQVQSSAQVTLRVRIAEVSRSVSKDLAFNWSAINSIGAFTLGFGSGRQVLSSAASATTGVNRVYNLASNGDYSLIGGVTTRRADINTVIDALETEGLVSILAEPSLTALSGQSASFLAGGEFPIPVVQSGGSGSGNAVTIVFKQYGVSLEFVPTVLSSNHISLHVRPEVSQLSNDGAITLNGVTVPALQTRRADTTIEMGSGETFAIGGLLQNNTTSTISRYPGLGDLPVLGTLFRSSNFQRNESELMIIVTPYIVKPISDPNLVKLPTDGLKPATDIERIFAGKIADIDPSSTPTRGATATSSSWLNRPRLAGSAGFDAE